MDDLITFTTYLIDNHWWGLPALLVITAGVLCGTAEIIHTLLRNRQIITRPGSYPGMKIFTKATTRPRTSSPRPKTTRDVAALDDEAFRTMMTHCRAGDLDSLDR